MEKIYIAMTVDVDPDNFDPSIFGDKKALSWKGVNECFIDLIENTKNLRDDLGQGPKFTWFVRADTELKDIYDSHIYLFEKYSSFWKGRVSKGNEIGWHPHVDNLEQLKESFNALNKIGQKFSSVRIGHGFHSNSFMAELASYGFVVDSSALPGRFKNDRNMVFDWLNTPPKPYFPSMDDYRVPGNEHLDILEVPFSMVDTKVEYDKEIVKRYLNLSYRHEIIRNSIAGLIENENLLVTILHPSELLKEKLNHPLLSFNINTVVENLRYILEEANKNKKTIEYVTISEIFKLVKQGIIENANQQDRSIHEGLFLGRKPSRNKHCPQVDRGGLG